jgi:hypothetical protein
MKTTTTGNSSKQKAAENYVWHKERQNGLTQNHPTETAADDLQINMICRHADRWSSTTELSFHEKKDRQCARHVGHDAKKWLPCRCSECGGFKKGDCSEAGRDSSPLLTAEELERKRRRKSREETAKGRTVLTRCLGTGASFNTPSGNVKNESCSVC